MNAAQIRRYWWSFGPVRAVLVAQGKKPAEIEARRHALHVKALGRDKSSKAFTNGELDAVMAAFRAVHDGGNLDAQLAALDAPEERREAILNHCHDHTTDMFLLGDARLHGEKAHEGYVAGTAKNVIGKTLAECTEAELGKVCGCLAARVRRMRAENPTRADEIDAERAAQAMDIF